MIVESGVTNSTDNVWTTQTSSGYSYYTVSDGTTSTANVSNGVATGSTTSSTGVSSSDYSSAISKKLASTVSGLANAATSSQMTSALKSLTSSRSSVLSNFNLTSAKSTLTGLSASTIKRSTAFGLTAAETLGKDLLSSVSSAMSSNSDAENQAAAARMGVTLDGDLSTLETATISNEGSFLSSSDLLSSSINTTATTSEYNASSTGLSSFVSSAQDCGFSVDTLNGYGSYYTSSTTLLTSSDASHDLGSVSSSDLSAYGEVGDSLAMTSLKSQVSEITSKKIDYSTDTNLFNMTFFDTVSKNSSTLVSSLSGSSYTSTANSASLTKILTGVMSSKSLSTSTVSSALSAITGSKVSTSTSSLLTKLISGKTMTTTDVVAMGRIANTMGTSITDYFKSSNDDVTYTSDGETIRWNNGTTTSASDETIHWNDGTISTADSKLVSAYAPEVKGLYGGNEVVSTYF